MNDITTELLLSSVFLLTLSPFSCSFIEILCLLLSIHFPHLFLSLHRTNNLTTSLQSQIQNLRDNVSKMTDERTSLKKELDTKNQELQEKVRTITQVKKIGRRYKTQYDELKVEHDKVTAQ